MADRHEAALTEWRAALQLVEQEFAQQPNSTRWNFWKARLLACLGRAAEAEQMLRVYEQLVGVTTFTDSTAPIYAALGRSAEVLAVLERLCGDAVAAGNHGRLVTLTNALRFDPTWDAFRNEPRFQALLETPAKAQ